MIRFLIIAAKRNIFILKLDKDLRTINKYEVVNQIRTIYKRF
jgi:hypothetical protein